MEYDLYDLADESKQPCAFLPRGLRKGLGCWDNSFNRPGFDRAEFSATLVDVAGLTRPEFDELKRRLCAATEPYRAESQWLYWLPFPAVGAVFALQATVLRATFLGAVLPVVVIVAVYAVIFAQASAVASHNARVDEDVDGVLAELNARKGRAVAALRREHVGACVGRRNRRSRIIVFGASLARSANAPGYVYTGRGATAV